MALDTENIVEKIEDEKTSAKGTFNSNNIEGNGKKKGFYDKKISSFK